LTSIERDRSVLNAHEAVWAYAVERYAHTRALAALLARTLLFTESDDARVRLDDDALLSLVARCHASELTPIAFVEQWSHRTELFDVEQSNVFFEPLQYVQIATRLLVSRATWPAALPPRGTLLAALDAQASAACAWLASAAARAALCGRACWLTYASAVFADLWRIAHVSAALSAAPSAAVLRLRECLRASSGQFQHAHLLDGRALTLTSIK
jgi:hypothetical protein